LQTQHNWVDLVSLPTHRRNGIGKDLRVDRLC
jgi:hypothetical protein